MSMVIATVIGDVLTNKLFRFDNLIVEKVGSLLQYPLSMVPSMVVAILSLCASLAKTYLDSPIDRFTA